MTLELKEGQDIYVKKGMIRAEFNFWVGVPMDKFYDGLQEMKFVGTKCSKCGKVFLPPRKICGDCFAEANEFVDLPETGVLKNFTTTNYKISERGSRKVQKDIIVGLVQVDGADSGFITQIINTTPDKLEEGMKVKVVWAKKPKGIPEDIAGFEPV